MDLKNLLGASRQDTVTLRVLRSELFLTPESRHKGTPVISVHPAVEKRVGEGGAHGHDVENRVQKPEVSHHQDAAVNVNGQLEGMERQPAHRKHHNLQR